MRRLLLVGLIVTVALASGAPLRAHEVFRFVGFVTKWDPKKQTMVMDSREVTDGKAAFFTRVLILREECRVMRLSAEVKRSELKAGLYVVVDAAGVDINNLEATEIEIVPLPPPKKKK